MAKPNTIRDLLNDPHVSLSIVWATLKKLYGTSITAWEPDTFALSLEKSGVRATAGLMSKVLAAQTVMTSNVCFHDHEALFALALACDGIPAISGQYLHPTPEQLVAAVDEISVLRGKIPNDDEGFDPDEIDAAISGVLAMDGFFVAPDGLGFVQHSLDRLTPGVASVMRDHCRKQWDDLKGLPSKELLAKSSEEETSVGVQLHRLADIQMARRLRAEERVEFHDALNELSP